MEDLLGALRQASATKEETGHEGRGLPSGLSLVLLG